MTDNETHGFESFFENVARHKQHASVNYAAIKRALDPLNIIKAGQPYPDSSVEYFLLAWGETVRQYPIMMGGDIVAPYEPVKRYDVIDWLTLLVGAAHVDYHYRKLTALDGFFMSQLADDIHLMCANIDTRRWVATDAGCAALAIDLCHWRRRKGLDYTRINQHAMYMAHRAALVTGLKYNEAMRDAVRDFMNGTQLDVWESAVNGLDIEEE